ncbi:MAG TPA: hypothetical protein VNM87_14980 [Candidatus Udaeobacter sp.]|nr:hypothetical protein [Candidatus Udaeobacter sp.]
MPHGRALSLVLLGLAPLLAAGDSLADPSTGLNPLITFPLHARVQGDNCSVFPVDCSGTHPTVNVPPNTTVTIYLMANNYSALAGVQTAFYWDPGWTLGGAFFDCLPGQLTTALPVAPGGADAGTVTTSFDCVNTGYLLTIGRLVMTSGSSGCLWGVASSHQDGTYAVDCLGGRDFVPKSQEFRLGRICVSSGGTDVCAVLDPDAIQPTTWGQVKATYR